MNGKYKQVVLTTSVVPEGENPVFSEYCTHVSIDDEGAGPFIVLKQFPDNGNAELRLDLEEMKRAFIVAHKMMCDFEWGTNK